jgi:hypothetical protein
MIGIHAVYTKVLFTTIATSNDSFNRSAISAAFIENLRGVKVVCSLGWI